MTMSQPAHATRLERILGVGLTEDAMRQWPQSGELLQRRDPHRRGGVPFRRAAAGRRRAARRWRHRLVGWSTDDGDGRVYRNVSIAELRDAKAVRVTDYW